MYRGPTCAQAVPLRLAMTTKVPYKCPLKMTIVNDLEMTQRRALFFADLLFLCTPTVIVAPMQRKRFGLQEQKENTATQQVQKLTLRQSIKKLRGRRHLRLKCRRRFHHQSRQRHHVLAPAEPDAGPDEPRPKAHGGNARDSS